MSTTTQITGEIEGPAVGGHATEATLAAAEAAANTAATQITETITSLEVEAGKEAAQETALGGHDAAPQSAASEVLGQVDLATVKPSDLEKTVSSGAVRSIEDDAQKMKTAGLGGYSSNSKTSVESDMGKGSVRTGAGVANGIAGTKLGVVSKSLVEGSAKADGGNLKGGNTLNAAQNIGLGRGQAPAMAPKMAAAPAGPGMGGGSARTQLASARSSVSVDNSKAKVGEIARERALRGDAPSGMSRADWEAEQHRLKVQPQANNPNLMQQSMHMAPKPPSSINGEYMGGSESA